MSERTLDTLEWRSPPTRVRGRRPSAALDDIVTKLKSRPAEWALVVHAAKSSNTTAVFRRRGCEVRSHIRDDGGFDIYARWPEAA